MSTEITRTSLSGPWSAEPTHSEKPPFVERQAFATGTRVFCRPCKASGRSGGAYDGAECSRCAGRGVILHVKPLGEALRGGRR